MKESKIEKSQIRGQVIFGITNMLEDAMGSYSTEIKDVCEDISHSAFIPTDRQRSEFLIQARSLFEFMRLNLVEGGALHALARTLRSKRKNQDQWEEHLGAGLYLQALRHKEHLHDDEKASQSSFYDGNARTFTNPKNNQSFTHKGYDVKSRIRVPSFSSLSPTTQKFFCNLGKQLINELKKEGIGSIENFDNQIGRTKSIGAFSKSFEKVAGNVIQTRYWTGYDG